MTIGFDSIGQGAIGELASTDDVIIVVPGAAAVSVTASVPIIIGTIISPPGASETVTVNVPAVRAGKSELPTVATVTVTPNVPQIAIGVKIAPTTQSITLVANVAQPRTGLVVFASNTVTMNTNYGEIGSSSIGEFAIGEGDTSTRVALSPPFLIVTATSPLVTAGKSVFAPAPFNIGVTTFRPEIDSRHRKLKTLAIAN